MFVNLGQRSQTALKICEVYNKLFPVRNINTQPYSYRFGIHGSFHSCLWNLKVPRAQDPGSRTLALKARR